MNSHRLLIQICFLRETGKRHPIKYQTSPFFYLHTINAYEDDGHLVIDICCYARYISVIPGRFVICILLPASDLSPLSPAMLNCMYLEELSKAQTNPQYAK